jgi:hypothetical protein
MKKLTALISFYIVLSIIFVSIAFIGQNNYNEYYVNDQYHYNETSSVSIYEYESGGNITTENGEYEVRLYQSEDLSVSKNKYLPFKAYAKYGNNSVLISSHSDSVSGTIEYEGGSSLTLITQTDSNGRSNNITYSNSYDGAYCTIYVDENLQQTDSVDVQECYDLFNMEDVEKLYSDIKIISEKFSY